MIDSSVQPAVAAFEKAGVAEDIPENVMTVRVLRTADELRLHLSAWQRLVETALEPNPFYEPFMLLPAILTLGANCELEFVVVESASRKYPDRRVWCGLFPLERRKAGPGGALGYRQLWKHLHCFLCTPLVRGDVAELALAAFFKWLANDAVGGRLLKFDTISGDGPFHQLLVETLREQQVHYWVADRHTRALFRRGSSPEDYLLAAMPRKRRHEIRRLAKRFAELGRVEFQRLQSADQLDAWLNDYLQLESEGWKGRGGTALSCSEVDREFFRAIVQGAFDDGKLMMLSLELDGRVIAQKCNLITGSGGFAFKIAFAEGFAKYSPGVLLEIHNIERLHEHGAAGWMDSCAQPGHPMINQLWKDRRTIESLWVAGSGVTAPLALSFLPLARWLSELAKARRKPSIPASTEKPSPIAKVAER